MLINPQVACYKRTKVVTYAVNVLWKSIDMFSAPLLAGLFFKNGNLLYVSWVTAGH
jgi:hypothetical protein